MTHVGVKLKVEESSSDCSEKIQPSRPRLENVQPVVKIQARSLFP